MGSVVDKLLNGVKKSYYFLLEYLMVLVQWKLRFFRVQLKKWQRCSAQKLLDKAYGRFGAEAYAAYRGGEKELDKIPFFDEKLKAVEEAEARLFKVDESIEEIHRRYEAKKEEIRARYEQKRSAGSAASEEE